MIYKVCLVEEFGLAATFTEPWQPCAPAMEIWRESFSYEAGNGVSLIWRPLLEWFEGWYIIFLWEGVSFDFTGT